MKPFVMQFTPREEEVDGKQNKRNSSGRMKHRISVLRSLTLWYAFLPRKTVVMPSSLHVIRNATEGGYSAVSPVGKMPPTETVP
jgi:hypothetical protein